jgi:hypothetical protein
MTQGTLSYDINGTHLGIAFQHENLKVGPILAAVAMMRRGGFMYRYLGDGVIE